MPHNFRVEVPVPEIYISTDVETDGPIPGVNSMLSFASAAFLADKTQLATFSANLRTLDGATPDPKTMDWWKSQPQAWEACRKELQEPAVATNAYVNWIKGLGGKPVFVAYPAGFDFLFVYWYLIRFTGASPFSHSALDIKTYAMAMLGTDYRDSTKRNMPSNGSTMRRIRTSRWMMRLGRACCSAICLRRISVELESESNRLS